MSSHPEQLLISSLLTAGNSLAAQDYGVDRTMFSEYSAEYSWLIDFRLGRGYEPELDVFKHVFPDFDVLAITDVSYASELLREHHSRQQISSLLRGGAELLRSMRDPAEIISSLTTGTQKVIEGYNVGRELVDVVTDTGVDVDHVLSTLDAEGPSGIPFTHPSLASRAWGQQPGEITVFAARTNIGKSWCLSNETAHAVMAGKRVVYWAGEMTSAQMRARLQTIWFNALGITHGRRPYTHSLLRKGYDSRGEIDTLQYKKDREALAERLPGSLFIPDVNSGLTTPTTVASWISKYSPDLVALDHISLMGDSTGQRATMGWNVLASITGELKTIATGMEVPIMTASQINREGDSKTMLSPPKLVNLSQSDSVGQDADNVITLTRWKGCNDALVYSLEKARSSEAGLRWWSKFDPDHGDFAEVTKVEAEELYYAWQESRDDD